MTTDVSSTAAESVRWRASQWQLLPAVARPPLLTMALDEVLVLIERERRPREISQGQQVFEPLQHEVMPAPYHHEVQLLDDNRAGLGAPLKQDW